MYRKPKDFLNLWHTVYKNNDEMVEDNNTECTEEVVFQTYLYNLIYDKSTNWNIKFLL